MTSINQINADLKAALGCRSTKGMLARLHHLGHTQTCGRCCGTGCYSWNRIDGEMCYGCNGYGQTHQPTRQLVGTVRAQVANGELEEYFAELRKQDEANAEKLRKAETDIPKLRAQFLALVEMTADAPRKWAAGEFGTPDGLKFDEAKQETISRAMDRAKGDFQSSPQKRTTHQAHILRGCVRNMKHLLSEWEALWQAATSDDEEIAA